MQVDPNHQLLITIDFSKMTARFECIKDAMEIALHDRIGTHYHILRKGDTLTAIQQLSLRDNIKILFRAFLRCFRKAKILPYKG